MPRPLLSNVNSTAAVAASINHGGCTEFCGENEGQVPWSGAIFWEQYGASTQHQCTTARRGRAPATRRGQNFALVNGSWDPVRRRYPVCPVAMETRPVGRRHGRGTVHADRRLSTRDPPPVRFSSCLSTSVAGQAGCRIVRSKLWTGLVYGLPIYSE
jgi:hypothetical protein